MARAKPLKKEWQGFFNYVLTEQDKKGITKFAKEGQEENRLDYLTKMTEDGYKVTFTYEPDHGVTSIAVTGTHRSYNEGWTLVLKHASLEKVLVAALYVVYDIYQGGEWPVADYDSRNVDW